MAKVSRTVRDKKKAYEAPYRKGLAEVLEYIDQYMWCESRAQLAREAGLSESTVSNALSGTTRYPEFRTLYKMALAAGVTWTCYNNGQVVCDTVKVTAKSLRRAKAA